MYVCVRVCPLMCVGADVYLGAYAHVCNECRGQYIIWMTLAGQSEIIVRASCITIYLILKGLIF